MPPIFVISLVRSVTRRTNIRSRLDAAGFQYKIVDAVDGRDSLSKYNYYVDDNLTRLTRGRSVSNNEIGCYLSHFYLWERIALEGIDCALILEDDAKWDDDLSQVIDDIMAIKQEWGICLLTSDKKCMFFRNIKEVGKNRFFGYPLKRTMALTGYLIKKEAAANMCNCLAIIHEPVDIAICRHWEYKSMRFSVRPHVIRHDEANTTIDDRSGTIKKLHFKIYGGLLKTGEWFRRIYYYCACK